MTVYYTPEEMAAKLKRISNSMVDAVERGMKNACKNIEGKAKFDCTPGKSRYYKAPYSDDNDPRRKPPHMRDTIYSEVRIKSRGLLSSSIHGVVGTPKEYAIYVHEGTSRMQARPFILDNIIDEKDTTLDFIAQSIGAEIRKECV